jgi:branched-chain amino acid transport system substrate-binding protein
MKLFRSYLIASALLAGAAFPNDRAYAEDTIKIGAPVEVSGKFVSYGAAAKRGIEMAVDIYGGKVAGKKIEVLFRDLQSDPQVTANSFTQLLAEEKVNFLIGPIATPMTMAGLPAWRRTKALWVVPGATTPLLEEEAGKEPMLFHTFP